MPDAAGTTRRWILLLRGINVGGAGRLAMADLRTCLAGAGFTDVQTYVQSGNVVLDAAAAMDADDVGTSAGDAIETAVGFRPAVLVRSVEQMDATIADSPYRSAGDAEPKTVHYFFLVTRPDDDLDLDGLGELAVDGEEFTTGDDVIHLLAPNGVGRSKFVAALTRRLGNDATARNHRTVMRLVELTATDEE